MSNLRIRPSWWLLPRGKRGRLRVPRGTVSHDRHRDRAGRVRAQGRAHLLLVPPPLGPRLHLDRHGQKDLRRGVTRTARVGTALPARAGRADLVETAVRPRDRGGAIGESDARWPAQRSARIEVLREYSYRTLAGPPKQSGKYCPDVQSHGPRVLITLNSIQNVHQQIPLKTACRL